MRSVSILALCMCFAAQAVATTLTASLTVDDDFQLYVSTDDSVLGTLVGEGSTAQGSWASNWTFTCDLTPGVTNYLHVVGWDLYESKSAFLGQFELSNADFEFRNGTQTLLTDPASWDISNTGFGSGYYTPDSIGANLPTTSPWNRTVPGISTSAQWIWSNGGDDLTTRYFSSPIIVQLNSLNVSVTDGGSVTTPGTGVYFYNEGTVVPILAAAKPNYHFTHWTGTAVTSGGVADPAAMSTTATVIGELTLQANFALDQKTVTITAGAGGSVSTPGQGTSTYDYGTAVPVVAAANPHYHFVAWTGTAVTLGMVADPTSATTTMTVTDHCTLQANFALDQKAVTITASAGGSVGTPGQGVFTYDYGTGVLVVAAANPHYHFVAWTGTAVTLGMVADPTSATTTVTLTDHCTLQAYFALDQMTVTITASAGGSVNSPGQGTFTYDYGTTVPVVAAADPHHHFAGWTGTAVTMGKVSDPTSASTTLTVTDHCSLQANFEVDTYTLTVSAADGYVTRVPDMARYAHGETVVLQATPANNYEFKGWSGDLASSDNPVTVTMDSNKAVTAEFGPCTRTLIISSTAGGSVDSPGEGTFEQHHGDQVMLNAVADPLFVFVGWRGSLTANTNPYLLTLDTDHAVRAIFESTSDVLWVDDDAPGDPGPGDLAVSDFMENGSVEHPFDSIQEAIEVAKAGARVVIRPGTYFELIDLLGKGIVLDGTSCSEPAMQELPVVDGQGRGTVITCTQAEDARCVLRGLVITGGQGRVAGGIVCSRSGPRFENCLIVGNRLTDPNVTGYIGSDGKNIPDCNCLIIGNPVVQTGVVGDGERDCVNGGAIYCKDSNAVFTHCTISGNYGVSGGPALGFKDSPVIITNSIVWGNGPIEMVAQGVKQPIMTYTDRTGGYTGLGNVSEDPLFAMPGYWADPADLTRRLDGTDLNAVWVRGDYHLRSQAGHWNAVLGWVKDSQTSPCIDAGDPNLSAVQEPQPNGLRINMGTYGGTCQASLSH